MTHTHHTAHPNALPLHLLSTQSFQQRGNAIAEYVSRMIQSSDMINLKQLCVEENTCAYVKKNKKNHPTMHNAHPVNGQRSTLHT